MKNAFKFFVIVAFVMVIGFSMITCDNGSSGGGDTNFRFRNQAYSGSLEGTGRMISGGSVTIDTDSYSLLNSYYSGLGPTVGGGTYTPSTLNLYEAAFAAYGTEIGERSLNNGFTGRKIDFVAGITLNMAGDAHGGGVKITDMIINYFGTEATQGGTFYPRPTTTFTITGTLPGGHPYIAQGGDGQPYAGTTVAGSTITVPTQYLFPPTATITDPLAFKYGGNVYKYEEPFTGAFSAWGGGFVTPWAGASASGSSGLTFNVNWDLNNIIEQRCTGGGPHPCASCKFVFANKYWERFSLTVN